MTAIFTFDVFHLACGLRYRSRADSFQYSSGLAQQ
jgi:hypothetical protein